MPHQHRRGARRWLALGLGCLMAGSAASSGAAPHPAGPPAAGRGAARPAASHRWRQASRATAGPTSPGSTRPSPPTCLELGLDQLVGQRFVFSFRGTVPPSDLVRRIELGEAAGVILFSSNFTSAAGLRGLTRLLQALPRPAALRSPLLVMTDQEGGEVARLPGAPLPSASETGKHASRPEARRLGEDAGSVLAREGVNMDLAPVLDVARPGSFLARQQRTYGTSAQAVRRLGGAFAAGLARAGIIATAKHFPGLGSATISTDDAPVRVSLARTALRGVDEAPFAAAISAGAPAVMLSTAVYPALDDRPAALSPVVATGELRRHLGFRGVSITDDLDAPALAAYGSPGQRALLGALAGTDLLLFAGSYESGAQAEDSLVELARAGDLPAGGLCRSAQRVLSLRSGIGVR